MARLLFDLLLAVLTALLWLATGFARSHHVFGAGGLPTVLHIAAALATAALFVAVCSQVVLRYGFARLLNIEPTELQRGLVAAAFGFAATITVLAHFGFDFRSILVFSTLIAAVVGLAVQPVLGSLISGLAAQRVVGVGDGILLGGDVVVITALRWRSVIARRPDGVKVVLPNARLVENNLEILPRDVPVRAEARFDVASTIPPHRLQKVLSDLIADFPDIDRTRPVRLMALNIDRALPYPVAPADTGPATIRYRAAFWVRHFSKRGDAESLILQRLWYGLRREGLLPSGDEIRLSTSAVAAALQRLDNEAALGFASQLTSADVLVGAGRALLYHEGEHVALPPDLTGQFGLLVDGLLADSPGVAAPAGSGLTREASIDHIKRLLADQIGPYASYAVDQAAHHGASLATICATVADEIEDDGRREEFLAAADMPTEQIHRPGLLFRTRIEAGCVLSQRPLRVVGHALILVAPDWAYRNDPGRDRA